MPLSAQPYVTHVLPIHLVLMEGNTHLLKFNRKRQSARPGHRQMLNKYNRHCGRNVKIAARIFFYSMSNCCFCNGMLKAVDLVQETSVSMGCSDNAIDPNRLCNAS